MGSFRVSVMGPGLPVASIVLIGGDWRMALLDEMQLLVGDLEAAAARRAEGEHERREVAAGDARERAGAERERLEVARQDARERADGVRERRVVATVEAQGRVAGITSRRGEIAQTLSEFRAGRLAHAAEDAHERTAGERERLAAAGQDARERAADERERMEIAAGDTRVRVAEILDLGRIWHDHVTVTGSIGGKAFRFPQPTAAGRKPSEPRPAASAPAAAKRRPSKPRRAQPVTADAKMASAVLGYLADHPGGAKLAELQARLKAPRMALVGILNEMIGDKRVRKDGKLRRYFAEV